MPTKKARITVTLPDHVYQTIDRFAYLTRQSRGSIVAELLTEINEPLMRTVALLDAAREAPMQVKQGLKDTIEMTERSLIASAGLGMAQVDWMISEMRKPTGDSTAVNPHDYNHGGQVQTTSHKKQTGKPKKTGG